MTHLFNPIGATLVVLLAALAPASCGDDSDEEPRSAAEILGALPSGYEYRPVSEAQEEQVLRQQVLRQPMPPEGALEELEDVEMRRVAQGGEVMGFAMVVAATDIAAARRLARPLLLD